MVDLNLNWLRDDGINLPMINDVPRNTFYDKILSENVHDKQCCDVGFGTGLLSLLAIKHGAKHVIAYEKDPSRFHLGQTIIDRLDLKDKIDLRNSVANSSLISQDHCDVVFHEIIHQTLWAEGVWSIRPLIPGTTYLPGTLFFELYGQEISDSTVQGLLYGGDIDHFNPGVDIDHRFINLINQWILQDQSRKIDELALQDTLFRLDWNQIHKDWSWNPGIVFQQGQKKLLASYHVDYNLLGEIFFDSDGTRHTDLSCDQCKLTIDTKNWQHKNILLQPRFGLKHNQDILYLDSCRNWGAEVPWVFIKPKSNLIFSHQFSGYNFNLQKI